MCRLEKLRGKVLFVLLFILFFLPCGLKAAALDVFVSILPQKYFAQRIGGELVRVSVMVKPGASPATYEPKPKQMAALTKADMYLAIGVPFESAWLQRLKKVNPEMRIVQTQAGIEKIAMHTQPEELQRNSRDRARTEKESRQRALDPHVWLSPLRVQKIARNMLQAFVDADPAHAQGYRQKCDRFIRDLQQLHRQLQSMFSKVDSRRFMVYHPSWGYLAHDYGLEQIPVEIEGKSPKPAQLHTLIQRAGRLGIKAIFVQPQFSTKSAELIAAEIGARVIYADPLAEDWMDNLRQVARKLFTNLR